jgi:hypothetical protein
LTHSILTPQDQDHGKGVDRRGRGAEGGWTSVASLSPTNTNYLETGTVSGSEECGCCIQVASGILSSGMAGSTTASAVAWSRILIMAQLGRQLATPYRVSVVPAISFKGTTWLAPAPHGALAPCRHWQLRGNAIPFAAS